MNPAYNRAVQYERNLSLQDLDMFADLEWEREMTATANRNQSARQQPTNLTAKIEDYLRSHLWGRETWGFPGI